ncbi:hypothetical protein B0T21DRAFT_277642, partial [Apiosordaria backusii]
YYNNLIVIFKTLKDYIKDLYTILNKLRLKNISISILKSFTGFSNTIVLGYIVDTFNIIFTK